MFLQLLNFDRFIEMYNIGEVKTYRIPSKSYDQDGLWSEVIFGPVGSKARLERFGYIDLVQKFIHPEVYDIITTVSEETSRIINEKVTYEVEDGRFVEKEGGKTGVAFLINSIEHVDFTKFCHTNKAKHAEYLEKTKKFILIDKFLVIPAGMRDFDIYSNSRQMDEINNLYTKLIVYKNQLTGFDELDDIVKRKLQSQLIDLTDHIKKTKMTGKKGLFRGTMLRKSLDYTSRLVLTNDPSIELGKIGLPWHTLVALYEPFVIYHLFRPEFNEVLEELKQITNSEQFDDHSFSKFVKTLINNPDNIPDNIKIGLTAILNEFIDDQLVMIKRDPVQARNSWFSAIPTITQGRVAYVNSVDLGPIGGDCIRGNVITYTLDDDNNYIQHVESIDDFYHNHKLILIEKRYRQDGVTIYDFLVDDPVYSIGINEKTNNYEYSRIQKWSIHNNIKLARLRFMKFDVPETILSRTKSCYVLDSRTEKYRKLDIEEVLRERNYLYFVRKDGDNQQLIPATDACFTRYHSPDFYTLNLDKETIIANGDSIGFDFTMEHEHVRSFLHENHLIQCNSDGDTVAIVPVFAEESKKEVREKMLPTKTKSKWIDPSSNDTVVYNPTLDAIATIYKATKV